MKLKLKYQLALTYTIGIVLLAVVSALVVSNLTDRAVKTQLITQGEQVVNSLAEQSKLPLLYQSEPLFADLASAAFNFPGVIGLEVFDASGNALYSEGTTSTSDFQRQDTSEIVLSDEGPERWVFVAAVKSSQAEDGVWNEVLDINAEEPSEQLGFIRVTVSKAALAVIQQRVFAGNITVSLIIAVIVVFFIFIVSARLTVPLERLSQVMKRGVEDSHKVRANIQGPIELQNMQRAFNSLMSSLERREFELVQAMNGALESARVKGEFAANVTHELRTPMNAVLGMMDLLLTMGLNQKQREYVEIAKVSGESLLKLIDEVLSFAEVDSKKAELAPEQCQITDLLEDIIGLLATQALKRDLNLGYSISKRVPQKVLLDPHKFRQILINLVGNAIKFTKVGEVAIHVDVVPGDPAQLQFKVSDTGIGIPPEAMEKVFDAFTQVDSSPDKEYGGTGLGLAISRQLVELMGGKINVSSEMGLGSVFTFTLPLGDELPSTAQPSLQELAGRQAVIVSNSPIVTSFARNMTLELGIRLTQFNTGTETLDYFRNHSDSKPDYPDVILIDEDLPALKGHDLARLLNEEFNQDAASVPVIVLIVNPWRESAQQIQSFRKLTKPLRRESFYDCMVENLKFVEKPKPSPLEHISRDAMRSKNILVVDDNKANQQVAKGMLERIGCQVDIANNGKEAVEMVLRKSYDLLLMDCYMPVMNGYDATRQIRGFESDGKARLPIIAMTANNSQQEAKKCEEAGMDDFLPKPLRLDGLTEKLAHWLAGKSVAAPTAKPVAKEDDGVIAPVDSEVIKELRANVGEVITSIMEAFLEDTPVYLQSIKHAIAKEDCKQVRELAHTIKGSAGNFGARRLIECCLRTERAAEAGDLKLLPDMLEELYDSFHLVRKGLEQELMPEGPDEVNENKMRLLIVDDDRSMRLALRNVFRDKNYFIEECGNGAEAIQQCERSMPDLIMMDAMMPGINGFDTCRTIRNLPHGSDAPILMVTALDNEDAITHAFDSGATDYIPKPIHFGVLKQRVERLIKASKTEQHVRKLAYSDSLTGLPNRSSLMQHMRLVLNRCALENREAAVLFLDLDRFKMVNDTLGHATGDLLLKAAADRIRGCVREMDYVARLGGDEFTVVLENVSQDTIRKIAEKICFSLAQPFVFIQQTMFVSASIGISVFPRDGEDVGSLMKHADSAMFGAKEKRNGYCFYRAGMEDEIARRLELERELRDAIKNDKLTLHYQPKFDLLTGELVGAEALVRWHHEKLGMMPPGEFIPLAEETDLINDIGNWVMGAAVHQIARWSAKGMGLRVAVNISGSELDGDGIHERLSSLLQETGVSANMLELEITESMLMENPQKNEAKLNALRAMGVTLAIDDFGTGFSSLNYLKRLPVDVLKIDRSFVDDIDTDENDRAIVSGIIALAKSLGLGTVAEGVETEDQRKVLQQMGCEFYQGYLASRPLPVDEFTERFLNARVINKASDITN